MFIPVNLKNMLSFFSLAFAVIFEVLILVGIVFFDFFIRLDKYNRQRRLCFITLRLFQLQNRVIEGTCLRFNMSFRLIPRVCQFENFLTPGFLLLPLPYDLFLNHSNLILYADSSFTSEVSLIACNHC